MPAFLSDRPGVSSALFLADQRDRAARADNAFATMLGQLNMRKQRAIQQNQFAAQMAAGARQEAMNADMAAQEIKLRRQNMLVQQRQADDELKLQRGQLILKARELDDGLSPAQSRKDKEARQQFEENYPDADTKAATGGYGSIDEVKSDLPAATDLQAHTLLQKSLDYRKATTNRNQLALTVANRLNQLRSAPAPTPDNPTPVGGILARLFSRDRNPDMTVQQSPFGSAQQVLQRRNQLVTGLLATHADKVTQNPTTGAYEPVLVPESWTTQPAPTTKGTGTEGSAAVPDSLPIPDENEGATGVLSPRNSFAATLSTATNSTPGGRLVLVINPKGKTVKIKQAQLADALRQGYRQPTAADDYQP